jgi:hypothetical protein
VAQEAVGDCDDGAEHQRKGAQPGNKLASRLLQRRRLLGDRGQGHPDLTERGARPCAVDHGDRLAPHDQGAREQVRSGIGSGRRVGIRRLIGEKRPLGYRRGLAREGRFVDAEHVAGDQKPVCRKALALPDKDNVAGHKFARRNRAVGIVADHPSAGLGQVPQRRQGLLATRFLHHDEANRGQGAGDEEQTFAKIAQHQVKRGGPNEQEKHRLAHGLESDAKNTAGRRCGKLIGTDGRQPPTGFGLAQSVTG